MIFEIRAEVCPGASVWKENPVAGGRECERPPLSAQGSAHPSPGMAVWENKRSFPLLQWTFVVSGQNVGQSRVVTEA